MNPSPSPRFSCRVVRACSALTSGDRSCSPTGLGSRHVEQCPDCQEYFGAANELDAALRAEARAYRVTSPGLEQDVLRAVRRAQPAPAPRRTRTQWTPFLAGAAAMVVVAVVTVRNLQSPQADIDVSPTELRTVLASAQAASNDLWDRVAPRAAALAQTDPLRQELDSAYSDARQAVDFLAANFLPSSVSPLSTSTEEADTQTGT